MSPIDRHPGLLEPRTPVHRTAAAACLLASPIVLATCGRDPSGPRFHAPAAIVTVSGDGQTASVGSSLPQPLVVLVSAADGSPVGGAAVSWRVAAGGATLSATSVPTDSLGRAAVLVTLGAAAGADTVRASVASVAPSAVFAARATAASAARLVVRGGDAQTAPAGTALPIPYTVAVRDSLDNPVPGAVVSWSVAAGGGSVSPAQEATDSSGEAIATRTLGGVVGTQSVTVSVTGLADSVARFTATATPNGTIAGTITTASGVLSPPATARSSALVAQSAPPAYTPDELIVTYRAAALAAPAVGSPALAAPATATALGRRIHDRLTALPAAAQYAVRGISPALLAARLRVHDSTQLDAVAAALRGDPAVASVERNAIVHLERHGSAAAAMMTLPADPLYPRQAWHYGMIDLPRAWAITTGSAGVLVAVVDAGIRYDHPAVAGNLTHDGYDFVSSASVRLCGGGSIDNADDGDGYDADPTQPADYVMDDARNCAVGLTASGSHGLHVAGTIGATGNDGVGVSGVSWTVRIRPVRVLGVSGFGTFYDIAQGILYAGGLPADDGRGGTVRAPSAARIINVSLGGAAGSTALHNAVIAATDAGALVVAAAGNHGDTTLLYPAAYPEALSVAAVGPDGVLASYSSYGSTVDLAAPGGDMADGDASFGVLSTTWNFLANAPAYDEWEGTSMATPHVSGVAALLLAQNPSLTAAQLRTRLTAYAVDAGAPGPDAQYGAGIVNARNSLTQSLAPSARVYARLYDAGGQLLTTVPVAADGSYAFSGLLDGNYAVYAGTDENGDGVVGLPGRLWGALGGPATPTGVAVDGAATYAASFSIAMPAEVEPNDAAAQANALAVGGYVQGAIESLSDVDWYRVQVPQAGVYTVETSPVNGACGFALEANTLLTLRDSSGSVIAANEDIDPGALDYCSRITRTLAPGVYTVAVGAHSGTRYRLAARAGT